MVKSPKIRHSKPVGEPLTIELSGADVKRVDPKAEAAKPATAADDKPAASAEAAKASSAPAAASAGSTAAASSSAAAKPDTTGTSSAASAARPAFSSTPGSSTTGSTTFGRDAGKPVAPKPASTGAAEPPRPAAPKPEAQPRRAGSPWLAGIVGGIVALGGAGAAWYSGYVPAPQQTPPPVIAQDNAAVEALQAELAALRAAVDELRAAPPPVAAPAEAPDLTDVNARIESLATLVEDLRGQISALDQAGGAGDPAALAALAQQLAALEARVAALPAEAAPDLSGLREAIGAASALARQASDTATQAASAAGALAPRIERIEGELTALAGQVAEAAEKPGVALAIAASALKAAVDRGLPFTIELDTYAGLAPDTAEIEALRPFAATGVPTRADIEARFDAAASAMIAAARGDDPQASLLDRLWASALSVVEVRPVGEVAGDEPAAIVARMEVAMNRGDYARAAAEYETLPAASRDAGATFMEGLRARLAADDLIGKVLAAALRA